MSDNSLRPIWTPEDYEQTVRDAAKHRAEPGVPDPAPADEADELAYRPLGPRILPYRRNPTLECAMCWAPPLRACDAFCLARLSAEDQIAHRDAVLDRTIAELGIVEGAPWAKRSDPDFVDAEDYRVMSCTVAGRHRVRPDPWRRVRRIQRVIGVAVVVLVLALAALWASSHAKAETFDVCPSGLTGVATADTSCAFAEGVRSAFYGQVGWTVFAYSPVTSKFYTMQCVHTLTDNGWWAPKRCYGINDAGVALVVFIA